MQIGVSSAVMERLQEPLIRAHKSSDTQVEGRAQDGEDVDDDAQDGSAASQLKVCLTAFNCF
jgi:hypothetical protein